MKKILAIDDQRDNLISIKGFLKNFLPDCELFLADSGKEGIAIAQKEQPDTILLDIIMPEMDGFEVCKILKQDDRTKFIPILMLSALGQDQESRVKGLELGADAFLSKPFIPLELKAQINVMLRIKEAEDKLRAEKGSLEETVLEKKSELVESERRISTLINNLQGIAYRCKNDKDWTMEFISEGIIEITGYTPEDIIENKKLSFNDLIIPEDRDRVWKAIQLAVKKRESFEINYRIETASGEIRYLLEKGNGVFANKTGEFIALEGFINDVTKSKLAEETIKQSEKDYRDLFNNANDAIYIQDKQYRFIDVNNGAIQMYGYPKEFFIGKTPEFLSAPGKNDMEKILRYVEKAFKGKPQQFDFWGIRKNGEVFPKIVRTKKGMYKGQVVVITIATDITERKLAEEALQASGELNRSITQSAADAIVSINQEGIILSWNNAAEKIFGYSSKEMINHNLSRIIPEKHKIVHKARIKRIKEGDKEKILGKTIEITAIRKDGTELPIELSLSSWESDYQKYFTGIIRDITERKLAEDLLSEQQQSLAGIIEGTNAGTWDWNILTGDLTLNDRWAEIMGYTLEELEPIDVNTWINSVYPADLPRANALLEKVFKKELDYYDVVFRQPHKDGGSVWVNARGKIVEWADDGKPLRMSGTHLDITERKKAEEEQKQSEERFKRLFDGLGDAVFVTLIGGANKGRILEVNTAALKQTGYSRKELLKMNIISDLSVAGSGEISAEIWERQLLKGETVTTVEKKKRKNGTEFWTEMIVTQIDFKGEKASLSINHDITNRKRAEQIQKALYNISNAVIVKGNLEKLIKFIQEELGKIIDTRNFYVALYDEKNDTLSLPFLADEMEDRTNIPAGKTLTKYVINTQKSLLATKTRIKKLEKSGDIGTFGAESEIWLGVPLKIENKVTGVLAVQSYTDENAYTDSDVEMLEFVSDQISISIRHNIAHDNLIDALNKATESDRLKSAFLATISHELRTPLNAIIGFSDLINNDWPLEEIYGFAKTINESGTHLLSIVEEIFDITLIESGETTINKKDENLHLILRNISKTIDNEQRRLNKENLELNLIIPSGDAHLTIYTDIAKFKQILLNLLKNALKFTHEGHINYGYNFIQQDDKKMVRFYVEDTGIGVPKDKQKLIFTTFRQVEESFSRTYGGTGIGLSISTKLTELLGGKLWIESEEGLGSTFYFTIPFPNTEISNINYETAGVIEPKEDAAPKEKTFLIVEDDKTSFEFLQIVLERPDTNIIWARDGKEAVKYCKEMPEITLVLMDINMQVMDGYEATRQIKKFRPQLPIIAQTAFAIAGDREKTLEAGCDDYIAKPIVVEELMKKIEKLI